MDENRLRRNKGYIGLAILTVGLGVTGYGLWSIANKEKATQTEERPRTQPAAMFQEVSKEIEKQETIVGELEVTPANLIMGSIVVDEGSYAGSFSITARRRPILIKRISMTFAQQSGIAIDATHCLDKTLEVDESCTVDIRFDPLAPTRVEKQVVIQADSNNSDGSQKALDRHVTLRGEAIKAQPVQPAQVSTAPATTQQVTLITPEPENPALTAYLQNRAKLGGFSEDNHVGPQKPEDEAWKEGGFNRSMSTYPTDMTRLVTMDKPIPAVLKLGLDTRYRNRAIAQVERDIYGNEGRLIVIPRGSTVIGEVGATGSTGEEKVQIRWSRIQRPDGAVFAIEAYGGDAMGRPGTPAYIDNRYLERYGNSLLTTILNVGITVGLNGKQTVQNNTGGFFGGSGSTTVQQDARAVATEQANQYFQKLSDQLGNEGQQIVPIRTVPPGTRITIFPSQDLYLKPINPTKEMRARLIAQQEKETDSSSDQFTYDRAKELTQVRSPVVSQPTAPANTGQPTYDPITGQPIRVGPAQATRPLRDINGYPVLPGNLGTQPVPQARPQSTQPIRNSATMPTGQSPLAQGGSRSAETGSGGSTTQMRAPWLSN